MIERQTIDGREATVAYFSESFEPADKDAATLIKISFDDGEVLYLQPPDDLSDVDEAEPELEEADALDQNLAVPDIQNENGLWVVYLQGQRLAGGFPNHASAVAWLKHMRR